MTYADWIGVEGQSYPEIASREVRNVHAQTPSPIYGYLRAGTQQKIYLFHEIEQARGWFTVLLNAQQPYDYAAVFAATDLTRPVSGLESFGQTHVSGDAYVGNMWPFFLGLPLGGLGGYFLRRWQEEHPGQALPFVPAGKLPAPKIPVAPGGEPPKPPKTAGDPYVGAPWLDIAGHDDGYTVGGPWLDMVGQDYSGYDDGYAVGGPWLDMIGPGVGQDYSGYDDGPAVGGPWLDMVGPGVGQDYSGYDDGYAVGGPWLDMIGPGVGAQIDDDERRRAFPQIKALIQSAIDEVTSYDANRPAAAYVWVLAAPAASPYAGRAPRSIVTLEGTTNIVPFSSPVQALDYLREVAQTRPVALAMFDRSSRHWPNPVSWRKSDDPAHEQVIAQHVASRSPTRASGDYFEDTYAGADTVIGTALNDVRRRARTLADKRAGNVIGVIHTSKDGLWHTLAFRSSDDADDWLGTASHDPASFTYAAYFDKDDHSWPHPVNEKIGGARVPHKPGTIPRDRPAITVGATRAEIEGYRRRAQELATAKPGKAVVVVITADGLEHRAGYASLDEAIDGLQRVAQMDKSSFAYAGAFDKASDGTAYVQQEEFGEARVPVPSGPPIQRGIAKTSGEWWAS